MIQPRSIFIGRTTELARLDALVRERARLVTLWGPGGAGKTTIASRWTDARRAGGGAVVWAELASVRTEPELLVALAMVLGTALDDHDDPPLAIVRSLEAQSALLVADNTEQLDATARATLGAIAARHERGVIVTSRDALGVEGEQTIAIDPLTDADALALYAALSGVEPDDAAQAIVRRLDALPLAIELAAARASLLGNDALLERLDRKLDVLGGPATSDGRPARHVTLRAAIAWSWELLEDTDREALITCALFDGPFDAALVEGAMSVAELSALDFSRTPAATRGPGAALASDALIAAGWPDERLSATAATKRLHTAIWTLRSLGFEEVLVSSEEGYFLDPRVRVDLR